MRSQETSATVKDQSKTRNHNVRETYSSALNRETNQPRLLFAYKESTNEQTSSERVLPPERKLHQSGSQFAVIIASLGVRALANQKTFCVINSERQPRTRSSIGASRLKSVAPLVLIILWTTVPRGLCVKDAGRLLFHHGQKGLD